MQHSLVPRQRQQLRRLLLPALWNDFDDEWSELLNEQQTGLTVWEDKSHYNIEASLPGLTANDIEVTLDKGILHIKGERKEEEEDKDRRYFRRASSTFSYRLALPGLIDEKTDPKTSFTNGVLNVSFAKAPQSQTKKIPVKASK